MSSARYSRRGWISRSKYCGASAAPFESLNFGTGLGDAPENVRENLLRLARAIPFS
ncbi:MAG: laccase domain-containing protein, partial [Nocardia sp.]|nr:laccase domain-containing protein [Nocardia sp.]